MMVLIAGPYRSGTNGEAALIAANLERLERAAVPVYQAGHLPVIGEWLALPLIGQCPETDPETFFYPVAHRLLDKCDAVLRIEGASKGADQDVAIARSQGKPVFYSIEDFLASKEHVSV